MADVYETANQVEEALRNTDEYAGLKEAFATVQANEEANGILKEFQGMQTLVYQKQQSGQQVTEEEAQQAQEVSQKMTENEITSDLMDKERELNEVLNQVNSIIMKPIQEIYQ
jgi:cell fate (sporulation/competence/biofilm development) regulator YlbF (YheA/YmcA/DUF963 family)